MSDTLHKEFVESRRSIANQEEDDDKYIVGPDSSDRDEKLYQAIDKWKDTLISSMEYNDPRQMVTDSASHLQANLIMMAHTAKDDSVRLNATKYVLEQAGLGSVKNVNINHNYDGLPTDQLIAMARSKLENIQSSLPSGQSVMGLFGVVDAEFSEESPIDEEAVLNDR